MVEINGVEMVDVREAAQIVGRTPETVRRWVWSERLAAVRHGNRLLIERSALEAAAGAPSGPASVTFAEWVAGLPSARAGSARRPRSAADLVLADRADRADGAGGADGAGPRARR